MSELLFAGALFLATHLGISNSPLRPALMRALSERGYQGLYSLVALVTVVYLVMAYNDAPRIAYLWNLDPRLYWVPKLLMLPAFHSLRRGPQRSRANGLPITGLRCGCGGFGQADRRHQPGDAPSGAVGLHSVGGLPYHR